MRVSPATDAAAWDGFLARQRFSPFLQSWAMGEAYRAIGQEPVRLEVRGKSGELAGICLGHVVPARRGRHLSIPYGPVLSGGFEELLEALTDIAVAHRCSFIRMSPFWLLAATHHSLPTRHYPSPLHLLAEHFWYVPLRSVDPWRGEGEKGSGQPRSEEDLLKGMRATQRNLIRRAEKEGVTVRTSEDPVADLPRFLALHEETRRRHGFTPYTHAFFAAQVAAFAPTDAVTLYLADYQGQTIAASVHMRFGLETHYHHGASTHRFPKIPASYLLQWTAIRDALRRGDSVYSFWGISPTDAEGRALSQRHPFAGVTLFKTGFGGRPLTIVHCIDVPLSPRYFPTRWFEFVRKWRRGF